jgi:hypothetical protein
LRGFWYLLTCPGSLFGHSEGNLCWKLGKFFVLVVSCFRFLLTSLLEKLKFFFLFILLFSWYFNSNDYEYWLQTKLYFLLPFHLGPSSPNISKQQSLHCKNESKALLFFMFRSQFLKWRKKLRRISQEEGRTCKGRGS